MGTIKQMEVSLLEDISARSGLGAIAELQEAFHGESTIEWLQHQALHSVSPSVNCSYCVQNADVPDMEVLEDESEVYGD